MDPILPDMYGIFLMAACASGVGAPGGPNDGAEDDDATEGLVPAASPLDALFGDEPVDIALELSPEAIAGLATAPDQDVPEVEATFTWGDETRTVGVKLKGGHGSFRTFDQKPSFTVDFEELGGAPLFGLRYMHLNNYVQDVGMIGEHAAYTLWAVRGVPAPRHGYARLTVNGELFGLYGVVDKVDEDLLDHRFGTDEGVLLEGEMDDFVDHLVDDFLVIDDGGAADPYAPVRELVAALDAAPWDARGDVISAWFDRDRLLDAWAVEVVSGNDDGYVTWTNNYFLWWHPGRGRFEMVMWGPDQAFLDRIDVLGDWRGRLWTDCRNDADCNADLEARILAVAGILEDPDWRARMEAVATATDADCVGDPRAEGGADACIDAREGFFSFLDERPAEVRARLNAAP